MKAKSFKKFFVSIALSAVLTFSTAATAFAATAQLMPVEQSAELSQEQTDTPSVDDSDSQAAGASYLTSQARIAQIAASESSVTVQWTPVTNAAKYAISISPFSSGSYKLLGYFDNSRNKARINKLKAGSAYKVRITALTSSGTSISSRIAGCTTLYSSVTVKTSYASTGGYTFNMNTVNPANSISGYKVIYQSSAAHKLITKYYTRPSFTLPLNKNTFYQVKIYPYLLLNNKRYVTTTPTTRYISMGIVLKKSRKYQQYYERKMEQSRRCKQLLRLREISKLQFLQESKSNNSYLIYPYQHDQKHQVRNQSYRKQKSQWKNLDLCIKCLYNVPHRALTQKAVGNLNRLPFSSL